MREEERESWVFYYDVLYGEGGKGTVKVDKQRPP